MDVQSGGGVIMAQMTEDQIEAWSERRMDVLDRCFLAFGMGQAEYESQVDAIDRETRTLLAGLARAAAGKVRPSSAPCDAVVARHFQLMGSDLCEWGRSLIEARWRRDWPGFAADRLRAAAEYRQAIARELAYARRGREGYRACLIAQGIPVNW
jgi:hypothetical protein